MPLSNSEHLAEAALDSLYDPVIVTDARGNVVRLNRAAEKLFGEVTHDPRPVGEHIGFARVVQAVQRAIRSQVSALEDDRGIVHIEVDHEDREYRLRATPIRTDATAEDPASLALGAVVVLEDVTHLKEIERLKNEFIGVASHELRTPVTSLLLSNELMLDGTVGPITAFQREVLEAQRQDLHRLQRLMNELLDLTRLESGANRPQKVKFEPGKLIQSIADSLTQLVRANKLTLDIETLPTPSILGDPSQITRALTNLVGNAIRHTRPGGKILLRVYSSHQTVCFEVKDTGEGIPKDYLERIFERFVQVPGATGGGAGLGLAIVQQIVSAHNGKIEVESEVGVGSVFRIVLPAGATDETDE